MEYSIASKDSNSFEAKRFKNKIAIVTGAGQGIGEATARRLGEEGATVVIVDIAEETSRRVLNELKSFGIPSDLILADLRSYDEAQRVMAEIKKKFNKIDVLINNVGGTIWIQPFSHYEEQQIRAEIDRSFWTTMWCCRAVIPFMLEQGYGSIVNVGSTAPRGIYRVPYAAAKGAIFAMTTSLAIEVAKMGKPEIRINCVAPGPTRFERSMPRNSEKTNLSDDELKWLADINEMSIHQYHMRPYGTPEEQAGAIAFMASDDASYITGQILTVAGGERVP